MPSDAGGSVASRAPRSNYKLVARTSEVDETLFATTRAKTGYASATVNGPIPGAAKMATLKSQRASTMTNRAETDAVMITRSDIERMKGVSSVLTPEEVSTIKKQREEDKARERAESNRRKENMLRIEEEAKRNMPPTETEQLKRAKDGQTLNHAQALLEEELDPVKRMNQMVLYSKCVTIRDAQIEEKAHILREQEEEERRLDMMMEVERIKALEAYEARELQRAADRRMGAKVLMTQIQERAAERQRQEELRDQDRMQMLAEIERMKQLELDEARKKRDAGKKLLEEVARANSAQIERKKTIVEAEKEEAERIRRYIMERDAREASLAEQAAQRAHEKELETARLRAQQEKAADRQSELDELRAQRAFEAYEREWRAKEAKEASRVAAINADLADARERQRMMKVKEAAMVAKLEQAQFQRIIEAQRTKAAEAAQLGAAQAEIRRKHQEQLKAQIAMNEEKRARERREYLAEGDKLREAARLEHLRLEEIKARKLRDLVASGVPAKYCTELARAKVE